jgi:hypothetical protein
MEIIEACPAASIAFAISGSVECSSTTKTTRPDEAAVPVNDAPCWTTYDEP